MEPFYLMPGQERCEQFKDANGVPKVRYSYCSLNGALFEPQRGRSRAPVRGLAGGSGPLLHQLKNAPSAPLRNKL